MTIYKISLSNSLCGPKKGRLKLRQIAGCLGTFSADAASELDVLWHDRDTLGVDGAQVGVLEKTNEVSFAGLLQGKDSRALESKIGLEVLGNFTDQALEWQFPDEKLSALLVTSDLTESDGSGPVSVWFLHTTSGRRALASGLGSKLLARSLSSGRFTGGLLGSSHLVSRMILWNSVVQCWHSYTIVEVGRRLIGGWQKVPSLKPKTDSFCTNERLAFKPPERQRPITALLV